MNDPVEKFFIGLMLAIGIPLLVLVLYLMFVFLPVSMWAEANCLRNGYPRSHVTIGLETYCSTLDGVVTVRVDKTK